VATVVVTTPQHATVVVDAEADMDRADVGADNGAIGRARAQDGERKHGSD
jgi:hypothetical protein